MIVLTPQQPIGELVAKRVSPLNRQTAINEILSVTDKVHPLELISSLFPKQVEEALVAALGAEYTSSNSIVLSADNQRQREAALKEQLFELELAEEESIFALEKEGRPAPVRRGDANPAAVLHESAL